MAGRHSIQLPQVRREEARTSLWTAESPWALWSGHLAQPHASRQAIKFTAVSWSGTWSLLAEAVCCSGLTLKWLLGNVVLCQTSKWDDWSAAKHDGRWMENDGRYSIDVGSVSP